MVGETYKKFTPLYFCDHLENSRVKIKNDTGEEFEENKWKG